MPINQINTSNTFQQWLISTQQLISNYNYYESDFPLISEHEERIDDLYDFLTYKAPIIDFFKINDTTSIVLEKGSTLVNPTFTWSISNPPLTRLNISPLVGDMNLDETSYTDERSYANDFDWTLTAIATTPIGSTVTTNKIVTLRFKDKVYWGVTPDLTVTASELLLASNAFESGKARIVNYNATIGGYPYYAYPDRFGPITAAYVNGFSFSDYTESTINFSNVYGVTSLYRIVRFDTEQHGSNIEVSWS